MEEKDDLFNSYIEFLKIYQNFANIMKLNLGCSSDVKEGYVNIDICNPWGLDIIVHDLNKTPYPFEDNTFDEVYASHIIEHLNDFHKTIMELHRICKPHAKIIIKAPFFASTKYFGDPSHKIPFNKSHLPTGSAPDRFSPHAVRESGADVRGRARGRPREEEDRAACSTDSSGLSAR